MYQRIKQILKYTQAPRIYSFLDRNRSMKRSGKYANTFKKINNMDRSMFKIYISWIKTKKKKFRRQSQKNVTFSIFKQKPFRLYSFRTIISVSKI